MSVRVVQDIEYIIGDEVVRRYGWRSATLYYFRAQNLLNSYRFIGDKKSYWSVPELEAIRNRPPEVSRRGPKPSTNRWKRNAASNNTSTS
jgi:hypothetical protein